MQASPESHRLDWDLSYLPEKKEIPGDANDRESLKEFKKHGYYPCDRGTMFGPAGSFKRYIDPKYGRPLEEKKPSPARRQPTLSDIHTSIAVGAVALPQGDAAGPEAVQAEVKSKLQSSIFQRMTGRLPAKPKVARKETTIVLDLEDPFDRQAVQSVKMFKSQQRVPESVRRQSRMIKEGLRKREQQKQAFVAAKKEEYADNQAVYRAEMARIPEHWMNRKVKDLLLKDRETKIFRTLQAQVVDQTNQNWRIGGCIEMVRQDRNERK